MLAILRLCLLALSLALAVGVPSVAMAQAVAGPDGAPDYAAWESNATRANDVLITDRASTETLERLRGQLVSWREMFLRRQGANGDQIATVRSQIDALGPVPAEGESEAEDIAERRAALNEELDQLTAPVRRAEEAYARADGLIARLDATVRDRQTNQILELNPTPLNPALWPEAAFSVADLGGRLTSELSSNYASPVKAETLKGKAPLLIIMVVVGLTLVLRGAAWVERAMAHFRGDTESSGPRLRVGVFIVSLATLILPIAGMLLVIEAADQSQLLGQVGTTLLEILTGVVLVVYAARWLGRQLAPPSFPPQAVLTLSDGQNLQFRLLTNLGGFLFSANLAVSALLDQRLISETAASVLGLPLIVLAGLFLFRIAQLMVSSAKAAAAEANAAKEANGDTTPDGPSGLVMRYLGRGARLVAIAGPLLAAIGYTFAGNALVFSTYMTLALLAVVAILQRFVRDLYASFRGEAAGSEGLIPVLLGFAIALLALPVLALIWGARVTDLSEVWSLIAAGVPIGESRISPVDFLKFALVFAGLYALTRLFQGTLKAQVLPRTNLDTGGRNAIVAGTGYVGIFLAALIAITSAGIDLSSLAIVAGALSVGIGFGLQTIVSNFVSGIILLIERPISEGDWIEVSGTMGVVKKISVRATQVETFDRRDVIVPNADLISTSVTNWTKGNLTGRIIVPVGVAYGTDTRKVEAILKEIVEAEPLVILNPPPSVLFMGFGADSLDFEIRAVLRDVNYVMAVPSEMRHTIAKRFKEEGIEIPFAQRDVWLRNPETLRAVQDDDPPPEPQGPAPEEPQTT
ncbi:small-conductance mechanosensitive channel [Litoreibacter ponti]|uniref:Small-conductance mechanosensitive channel n=1 Tax=Litoreibacter ponti TaxID=1510457 RepID=A0A2T6BJD8_9RHOB|nr:DUF3772 domain-containing protein [Litoreibacter ponti]PTX56177.1 small-conductance mechanosensitive channel [Litoreibacter ponti]